MGKIIFDGLLAHQDPEFGFKPWNLVSKLTTRNWRKRAVLRSCAGERLYIWISAGECYDDDGKGSDCYMVEVWSFETNSSRDDLVVRFPRLEDAIRYVNGKVPGTVFADARPVPEADIPSARPAPVYCGALPISKVTHQHLARMAAQQTDGQSLTGGSAGNASPHPAPED